MEDIKAGLRVGGLAAIAFLGGQIVVWRQLVSAGYFVATSPASSFFYLDHGYARAALQEA